MIDPRGVGRSVRGARLARAAVVLLVWCGLIAAAERPDPIDALLPGTPLATPLEITGGFCEFRIGHFHAGLDFGTGQRVGRPVMAPTSGSLARVRASGAGYGRSLYLLADDGRLLQFGHLDAFVGPIDAYVRAHQDSSGQYEQDLWPEAGRFRFRAGETMAWSGESGAGGPHLHFEIRRGDMAYHPLRAGLAVRDSSPPTLHSLTLEPLDDSSRVEGGAAPVTLRLSARPETLHVRGRVRAVVGARDGVWRGVDRMVPWSVAWTWAGRRVECRFDSVSWATDMTESDYLYDSGRVIGEKGLMLWSPAGFRPRVLRADVPLDAEAGTIQVAPGDPPRMLRLEACDAGGLRSERSVVIVAGDPRGSGAPAGGGGAPRIEFAALPGGWMRVTDRGAPASSRDVVWYAVSKGQRVRATPGARGWSAILGFQHAGAWAEEFVVEGRDGTGAPWVHSQLAAAVSIAAAESSRVDHGPQSVEVPRGAAFERGVLLFYPDGMPAATTELAPASVAMIAGPAGLPLRRAVRLHLAWTGPAAQAPGLYRQGNDDWEWVASTFDSLRGRVGGDTRRLGRFALFHDRQAPQATWRSPQRPRARGPYSRWAVEIPVVERGSGLDVRASYIVVDGRRVATEWDGEARVLRWRPSRLPARGAHRVEIVATDRAGNVGRTRATLVLE